MKGLRSQLLLNLNWDIFLAAGQEVKEVRTLQFS